MPNTGDINTKQCGDVAPHKCTKNQALVTRMSHQHPRNVGVGRGLLMNVTCSLSVTHIIV